MNQCKSFYSHSFSGDSNMCFGLEIVKSSLRQHGFSVENWNDTFKIKEDEKLLLSLYWGEQIYDLIKWRKEYNIKRESIIAGGIVCSTNPASVLPFVDRCYIGDADDWNGVDETQFAEKGILKSIKNCCLTPMAYEDLQKNRRSFCEISRGCKNKCFFCQYSWLKPYRELDYVDIVEVIKRSSTKSMRIYSADKMAHSQYAEIKSYLKRVGKNDTGVDVTMKSILKNPELLRLNRRLRLGVEGMSEYLRTLINKPISDNQIIELCENLKRYEFKAMDWYMIYGLPGENESDWQAFKNLLIKMDKCFKGHPFLLAIHWNAFSAKPMTPLQWAGCAIDYPIELGKTLRDFRIDMRVYHKPMMTGNSLLIRRGLVNRAGEKSAKLIYNMAVKSNLKNNAQFIQDEFRKVEGFEMMGLVADDNQFPWDSYVDYDKDKLLKIWQKVKENLISSGRNIEHIKAVKLNG